MDDPQDVARLQRRVRQAGDVAGRVRCLRLRQEERRGGSARVRRDERGRAVEAGPTAVGPAPVGG